MLPHLLLSHSPGWCQLTLSVINKAGLWGTTQVVFLLYSPLLNKWCTNGWTLKLVVFLQIKTAYQVEQQQRRALFFSIWRNVWDTLIRLGACLCVCSTIQVITNLVKMVKARDIRRPFCPKGHWLSEEVNIRADKVLDCDHNLDIFFIRFWFC